MRRLFALVLLFLSSLALSACGVTGDLDRPPPLWGESLQGDEVDPSQVAEDTEATGQGTDDGLEDDEDDLGYGIDVID